jgi:hypothetical protein
VAAVAGGDSGLRKSRHLRFDLRFQRILGVVENHALGRGHVSHSVNPVVALAIGASLGDESLTATDLVAAAFILRSVLLIFVEKSLPDHPRPVVRRAHQVRVHGAIEGSARKSRQAAGGARPSLQCRGIHREDFPEPTTL